VERPGAPQSTLYLGLPVAYPGTPDYIALEVTNALLGGSFASRVTSNIREQKGYTYSPRSVLSSRYHDAYWAQMADVSTEVTGPALKEIFYEIGRLRDEAPPEKELEGIKNFISGVFVIRNSSRDGIINQLNVVDLHGLGEDYLRTYVQKVNAVTPAQVRDMTKKYLVPEQMAIVVVGDREKIADQVAPYKP
jgi:predicted Zn-dependent peptidase